MIGFGISWLFREYTKEPWAVEAWAKAHAKARDPERCRKIAEARRGKPRPRHVIEAMRQARLGMRHTEDARRRMSEAQRRRGELVPGTILWSAEEDELLKTLPAEEVARRTGRTLKAIYTRRQRLGCRTGDEETEPANACGWPFIVRGDLQHGASTRVMILRAGNGWRPNAVRTRRGNGDGR